MRPLLKAAGVLLWLSIAALLPAQTPVQPGLIGDAPKISVAVLPANDHKLQNRLWITSMLAAVGSTSADAATSFGKREGNPLLASSNGTFGGRGLSIKFSVAAVALVPQICLRKHRELKNVFTAGNFAEAGIFTGTAIHNLQVH